MSKIYLASSWRNTMHFDRVLALLQAQGHEVYDFRTQGFKWYDTDPAANVWQTGKAISALNSDSANKAFKQDMDALLWCDVLVLLFPVGNSGHLELGYAAAHGAYTVAYVDAGHMGPLELMLKVADKVVANDSELIQALRG